MSLRSLRLASMSSIRRVRPSASKRFEGLKYSRSVWSRSVIATDSSSRPFCASASAAVALTRATYSPRCSCICSIVISEATERIAETNLPESSACSCSGSMVRRPSVAAAIETASRRRLHADVEVRLDIDAHAVAGDDGVLPGAHDPIGSTFMLTGV